MEIPDLSLRSTFSPPYYKDQTSSSPCMCKYTIYNLECGHPAEDHVDTKDCPHFQKTGVPCDRENPANRGRVSIKSEDRAGLCIKCIRRQREKAELDAMTRDEERAKQQSLAEAKEREEAAKAHEARMYKESAEEYERLRRKREQEDIEYMLQKSREEAAAVREQKERDDLARALAESCRLGPADRNVTVDEKVTKGQQEVEGGTLYWTRTDTTTTTEIQRSNIPPPPPPPPAKAPAQLPSPPQTPIRATPVRAPSVEKPAAPVDFSLPATGAQSYGHFTIGGRRQPIHESQKQQAAKYLSSPVTPISPAPVVRLGSGVQPNSPSPRQMPVASPSAVPMGDLRSGLRRTGGPRQSMSRTASGEENELERHLARRRTWEPRDDTSDPGSGRTSRAGSVVSDVSRAGTTQDQPTAKELDEQRRRGWRKDSVREEE